MGGARDINALTFMTSKSAKGVIHPPPPPTLRLPFGTDLSTSRKKIVFNFKNKIRQYYSFSILYIKNCQV